MNVHPLLFEPVFKSKLWGSRRLETVLGKKLPPGERIGESWELSGFEEHESVIRLGPNRGRTLVDIMRTWGAELWGKLDISPDTFPLLIKFIDAADLLSVQVHPPAHLLDHFASTARAKNEAWYVIDAEPEAFLYLGLKTGVGRQELVDALRANHPDDVLNRVPVHRGDSFYLPAGTVHAIGPGIVLAEVQSPSDTTFRLYDFDRVDPQTGRRRPLQVEEALACIDFSAAPPARPGRSHLASVWTTVTRVITCPHFYMERVHMVEGVKMAIPYGGMVVWIVLQGRAQITSLSLGGQAYPITRGDVVLLPAALKDATIETHSPCTWLEVVVPQPSDLAGVDHLTRQELDAGAGRYIQVQLPPME